MHFLSREYFIHGTMSTELILNYDQDSVNHVLRTTRSVRKRLDFERPVPDVLIQESIDIALNAAPGAAGMVPIHFMVITDDEIKRIVGGFYREAFLEGIGSSSSSSQRIKKPTIGYLAENIERTPALVIHCAEGNPEDMPQTAGYYGQILPSAWSFMLALRVRGLGTVWTALHLRYAQEIADVLGIPNHISQTVLFPVAFFKGEDNFSPPNRPESQQFIHWNQWGINHTD